MLDASLHRQAPNQASAPSLVWPDGDAVSLRRESPASLSNPPTDLESRRRWIWESIAQLLAASETGTRGSLALKNVVAELARVGVAERDDLCAVLHWAMDSGFLLETRNARGQLILLLTSLGFKALKERQPGGME